MKKWLTIIGAALVALYLLALVVPINPEERRPGTRLSGDLVDNANPDWSFMAPRQKIWVQTQPWYLIPHSVTTTSFVRDNVLYIPCGRCAGKRWPKNVAANPEVVVKIGEQLYRRRATRLEDPKQVMRTLNISLGDEMPDVDLYRMDPPAS